MLALRCVALPIDGKWPLHVYTFCLTNTPSRVTQVQPLPNSRQENPSKCWKILQVRYVIPSSHPTITNSTKQSQSEVKQNPSLHYYFMDSTSIFQFLYINHVLNLITIIFTLTTQRF